MTFKSSAALASFAFGAAMAGLMLTSAPAFATVCSDSLQLGTHTPICVPEGGDETQGVADIIFNVSGHITQNSAFALQITLTEPGSSAVSDFINVDLLDITGTTYSLNVTLVSDNASVLPVGNGNIVIPETGVVQNLALEIQGFYGLDATPPDVNVISDISDVPEPPTWAMMIAGFAGLGFAGYRKARNGAAFAS